MTLRNNLIFAGIFTLLFAIPAYAGTPVTLQKEELAYTQTPLGSSATYTGDWVYVGDYGRITLMVFSDESSDTDGAKIQQTGDRGCAEAGATPNVDYVTTASYTGDGQLAMSVEVVGRCARIVYVNGSNAQETFRLYGGLKTN